MYKNVIYECSKYPVLTFKNVFGYNANIAFYHFANIMESFECLTSN